MVNRSRYVLCTVVLCGLLPLVVSWAFAAWTGLTADNGGLISAQEDGASALKSQLRFLQRTWPNCTPPEIALSYSDVGMTYEFIMCEIDANGVRCSVERYTAGFPFRCVSTWTRTDLDIYTRAERESRGPQISGTRLGFASSLLYPGLPYAPRAERVFPLIVHPLPYVANALTYSVVCIMVWVGWSRYNAGRRRRSGCCERCGYSKSGIDAIAPCPECGQCTR